MKTNCSLFLTLTLLLPFVGASCKKEEVKTVAVSGDGEVVAVQEVDGKVVTTPAAGNVVVVKDSDLIWRAAESAVRSQVAAANSEDLETYLSYVHPEAPDYPDARAKAAKVFANNDLRTTLEKIEAESVADGEVKARFVLRTEKLAGLPFRDNRIEGAYVLRKDGATWKIFSSRMDRIDYLEPAVSP